MQIVTDQLHRRVQLQSFPPQRIISLVPSQTELLFDLGLDKEVLGITKFCVHPVEKAQQKIKVGGTKKLNLDKIDSLYPDLIIGNKEENNQADIEALSKKYPVWVSDVTDLDSALEMIKKIGEIVGRKTEAKELSIRINAQFATLVANTLPLTAAYFIWRKPYMVAASETFIQNMLERAGFQNVFVNQSRYPIISLEDLREANPEVILLSSEPYPFKTKHLEEFQATCPKAEIILVDGELFSWYGSRLLAAPSYFRELVTMKK